MSEKLKVGDRVRITHEGTVTKVSGVEFGLKTDDGNTSWFYTDEVMKVEKLAPAPLRPGTVGILDDAYVLVVVDDGMSRATNIKTGYQFKNPGVGGRSLLSSVETGSFKILHEPTA